jgi:Ca2+-binding EF-hand superfamily protein
MTTEVSQTELEEAFKLFDTDGDGKITSVELRELIAKIGGSMSEGEAQGLIHRADIDGNGYVDFQEFSKLWVDIRGDGDEEVRSEFKKLDKDNSGFIDKEEMLSIISMCEHFTGDKTEEARKCIDELDVDKDGRVSYPEFMLIWKYRAQ